MTDNIHGVVCMVREGRTSYRTIRRSLLCVSVGNYVAYHSVVSSSFDDGCAFFFLSVFCPSRHVVHALLEGHEAAKAAGLSQKNPVEQVGKTFAKKHVCNFCGVSVARTSPVGGA